ncbi:MAG TPA: Holliday junction branch migration protein RuvA [Candidatus Magasanikbacteria bacterium]|jgi:Holliday junction DNA helicase RuvA|nr:Holliday junction branch migration protein RuvA [Candidatus Magasanikbacteria bacterium]HQF57528.1 Holliday junction branch migration protein RuvA [Candidatus Magasanikbacteria bacterium]HQL52974.1 Holliday junction branch migration protein RuvA [Candidatus Magasanikbacteria bacterium]
MISYLQGQIIGKKNQKITILTSGGVGYDINVTPVVFVDLELNQNIKIPVYMAVRENSMDLFGFQSLAEKELFLKFLDVNGVGPKSALHLISLGSVEEISSAIARGDINYLTKVSGIGKKTAERIVVELKSKMSKLGIDNLELDNGQLGEVMDALVSLGYSKDEAREVVKNLDSEGKNSEELIRQALRILGK